MFIAPCMPGMHNSNSNNLSTIEFLVSTNPTRISIGQIHLKIRPISRYFSTKTIGGCNNREIIIFPENLILANIHNAESSFIINFRIYKRNFEDLAGFTVV